MTTADGWWLSNLRGRACCRAVARSPCALLALQASRYEGAGGGGDGGGGAGGDEQQPQPQPQQPWTAAYDGPMRVGGAWLVAKTPRAALSVLEQAVEITLRGWRSFEARRRWRHSTRADWQT